jgi:dienelactone hydrolase
MTTLARIVSGVLFTAATLMPQAAFAEVTAEQKAALQTKLDDLQDRLKGSGVKPAKLLVDVQVFAKGVEWCLRHGEFYPAKKEGQPSAWIKYCEDAIAAGNARLDELQAGTNSWTDQEGSTIRGYVSRVDGSVQPYALSLPAGFKDAESGYRWPLHVKLHGRGGTRNEVRFFNEHTGKKPQDGQNWIQLDVFGRTDNAYRWSGETDVFEALKDVQRRYRIDDLRITLWGFSMGGAGAWHLGLHHPSKWSSVGPGAGFVDFYEYQKQTEQLPSHQHRGLHIYDAVDYTLNMANVPLCTYGGELDAQLVASTKMVELAKEADVPVKLLIGPGVGHKFHPDTYKEFMAFHAEHTKKGRRRYPGNRSIRFVTWTLKYNRCEWLQIDELEKQYERTTVEGGVGPNGVLTLATKNVAALRIGRDVADQVELDGKRLQLQGAADDLLPDVLYEKTSDGWELVEYEDTLAFDQNAGLHKRHNLQGPIDDAFMESFICVRGTDKPWSANQQAWADWTLSRFEQEFDKWLRGRIRVVNDDDLLSGHLIGNNLILFGDPGSNAIIAKFLKDLPIKWTESGIEVNGQTYDADSHGIALIYPNPLNPSRYIVINSGHTMHEQDFKASNSWLFPKLGDIAVQKFERNGDGFKESTVWAELFDGHWQLP